MIQRSLKEQKLIVLRHIDSHQLKKHPRLIILLLRLPLENIRHLILQQDQKNHYFLIKHWMMKIWGHIIHRLLRDQYIAKLIKSHQKEAHLLMPFQSTLNKNSQHINRILTANLKLILTKHQLLIPPLFFKELQIQTCLIKQFKKSKNIKNINLWLLITQILSQVNQKVNQLSQFMKK